LHQVVEWAGTEGKRWAFSHGNAGARYVEFSNETERLGELDWDAISATIWKDPIVKEHKQAEFLVSDSFPWELVERIGVIDRQMAEQVTGVLSNAARKPDIVTAASWYY
jgi:hypothetical protein